MGISATNNEHPQVSLAIPVYNEEAVLPELLRRTGAVLDSLPGGPHQIVFADDGSSDRTLEMLEKAAEEDGRLLVVALSRNFGHQTALTAVLDHVSGDVAILMDADLQDPPRRFLPCLTPIGRVMTWSTCGVSTARNLGGCGFAITFSIGCWRCFRPRHCPEMRAKWRNRMRSRSK